MGVGQDRAVFACAHATPDVEKEQVRSVKSAAGTQLLDSVARARVVAREQRVLEVAEDPTGGTHPSVVPVRPLATKSQEQCKAIARGVRQSSVRNVEPKRVRAETNDGCTLNDVRNVQRTGELGVRRVG